jgi:hypothetical protein
VKVKIIMIAENGRSRRKKKGRGMFFSNNMKDESPCSIRVK